MEKKYIRDFSETSYKNPTIIKKNKKRRKKIVTATAIGVIVIVLAIIIMLLFTPYFRIKEINISGLYNIKEDDFRQIINQELKKGILLKHNNIFLFNIADLQEKISESYLLEWLLIEKKYYPAMLSISLEEKVSALTYLTEENCFNIDIQGLIIEKCNNKSSEFIQIRDESGIERQVGQQPLTAEEISYIIELSDQLEGQGIEIRTFKLISASSSDLRVLTERGFEIYFNKRLDISEQLTKFNILVREEIGADNLDKVSYVDLRFGEKVFYR